MSNNLLIELHSYNKINLNKFRIYKWYTVILNLNLMIYAVYYRNCKKEVYHIEDHSLRIT